MRSVSRVGIRGSLALACVVPLAFVGARHERAPGRRLVDALPSDTAVYLEVPDVSKTLERARSLPLARILREEEVHDFLAPLATKLRARLDEILIAAGEKPDAWRNCPVETAELAVVPHEGSGGDALVVRFVAPRAVSAAEAWLEKAAPKEVTVRREDGVTWIEGERGFDLRGALFGGQVVVAIGGSATSRASVLDPVVRRLRSNDDGPALASDPEFRAAAAGLQAKQPDGFGFLRFSDVEPGLAALGVPKSGALAVAETYVDGRVIDDVFVSSGEIRGLLRALVASGKPADRSLVDRAPDGTTFFLAGTADPRAAVESILEVFGRFASTVVEPLHNFEREKHLSIVDDLAATVGPDAYLYQLAPRPNQPIPIGDLFLALRLRDRARLEQSLDKLAAVANEPGSAISVEVKRDRAPIYTVRQAGAEGREASRSFNLLDRVLTATSPSIALLDDWVLLSYNAASLKNEVRRLSKPRETPRELKDAIARAPEGATWVLYSDPRPPFRALYDWAGSFVPMLGGAVQDLAIDLNRLPMASSITKHLGPRVAWSTSGKGGIRLHAEGSFGVETLLTPIAIGAALAADRETAVRKRLAERMDSGADRPASRPGNRRSTGAPASMGSGDLDARARSDIRKVDTAVRIFRAEHGAYPATLAELLQPTDDRPQGYLPGWSEIPNDPWGAAYHYVRKADGRGYELRSFGPNHADDAGGGDDVFDR
ncbi:MAG TPA: type II secretion system protein GspG [Planctomycetota bacterium]|nr:type II secretion system protein GspG [Planctomycetota bacterium]